MKYAIIDIFKKDIVLELKFIDTKGVNKKTIQLMYRNWFHRWYYQDFTIEYIKKELIKNNFDEMQIYFYTTLNATDIHREETTKIKA